MVNKTFTDKLFLLIVLSIMAGACSSLKDKQTIPPDVLPDSVIRVLSNSFPQATDALFQTIEKDRLYEVYFKLNGDPYYAALTARKILSSDRMYGAVPDSMLPLLPDRGVKGGAASLYSEPYPQLLANKIFRSKYRWNDFDYLLTWTQNPPAHAIRYLIRLDPYKKFGYSIYPEDIGLLPASVRQFLTRENLTFNFALISVDEKNEKGYYIDAKTESATNYQFTFNNSGKLISTVYRAESFYYAIDECPEKIRNFIKNSPAFSIMSLEEGYKFSDPAGTGYVMQMNNSYESCTLNFDENENFVNMAYKTAIYR